MGCGRMAIRPLLQDESSWIVERAYSQAFTLLEGRGQQPSFYLIPLSVSPPPTPGPPGGTGTGMIDGIGGGVRLDLGSSPDSCSKSQFLYELKTVKP
jgi:hypothetical protein